MTDNEDAHDAPNIERIVLDLVRTYVRRRVKQKTSLEYKAVRDAPNPRDVGLYNETAEKVARDAFLAVRSRTGADFREYFAGTLCSVPQFLSAERYELLTRELRNNGDEVRTLTMLALSATPTIFVPKKDS